MCWIVSSACDCTAVSNLSMISSVIVLTIWDVPGMKGYHDLQVKIFTRRFYLFRVQEGGISRRAAGAETNI